MTKRRIHKGYGSRYLFVGPDGQGRIYEEEEARWYWDARTSPEVHEIFYKDAAYNRVVFDAGSYIEEMDVPTHVTVRLHSDGKVER